MTDTTVVHLAGQAMLIIAELAGPALAVTLVVGLVVSLFQAVTSIQESTLSFLPKLVAVALVLLLTGQWMVGQLVGFVEQLYASIPGLVQK
ncbi:MAG: flagellar biosynthesis protein FliQ [Actinomycetota bacterium]|nr:flagellar biosynthesis protein FliQ [Actinomycetota bacterium]